MLTSFSQTITSFLILSFGLILTVGCSTNNTKNDVVTDGGYYQESSYKDRNYPPTKMAPPSILASADNNKVLEPMNMRTQADYNYSLGEAYSLEGNAPKAIEAFKYVLIYDPDAETVKIRLAKEYLKLGQFNNSIGLIKEVIAKNPKNSDAKLLLAGLYTSTRNYPAAIENYEEVIRLDNSKNKEVPLYLAAVYSEMKEFDKAVKLFESLIKNPNYANKHLLHYYIGRVREEQDEVKFSKLAEESYNKSIEIKPEFVDAVIALGALYKRQKSEDKAFKIYENFQKTKGPNIKIAEVLGQMYLEKQRYDEAFEQLEIQESQSEDSLNVKVKMALILIEKKVFDKAIVKLEEILNIAPDSDKIRFYLAAVYEEINQDQKAVDHYTKINFTSSFFGEAVVHAGYLLKNLGKLDEAVKVLAEAYENKKDYPQIYAMYSSLLDEKKEYKRALEVLDIGIKKFPDNAQLHFYYGTILDRVEDKSKVINVMKKVIELDPNHSQGLNFLAFTWAELNQNIDEAEKLSRRAVELDPQDGYILDTLGWILYRKGSKQESLKYLEAAMKFQPNVSVIAEHLGDVYKDLSLSDKAKKMYEKAFNLENDENKRKILKEKIIALEKQVVPNRLPASVENEKNIPNSQ